MVKYRSRYQSSLNANSVTCNQLGVVDLLSSVTFILLFMSGKNNSLALSYLGIGLVRIQSFRCMSGISVGSCS